MPPGSDLERGRHHSGRRRALRRLRAAWRPLFEALVRRDDPLGLLGRGLRERLGLTPQRPGRAGGPRAAARHTRAVRPIEVAVSTAHVEQIDSILRLFMLLPVALDASARIFRRRAPQHERRSRGQEGKKGLRQNTQRDARSAQREFLHGAVAAGEMFVFQACRAGMVVLRMVRGGQRLDRRMGSARRHPRNHYFDALRRVASSQHYFVGVQVGRCEVRRHRGRRRQRPRWRQQLYGF
mmetsp:Transcript_101897/g.287545  ORF Transcript_101897/g.287545 Transcript_101897/m.287545 type:complete len:238 (+) Transcript_101897:1597-2310(+)